MASKRYDHSTGRDGTENRRFDPHSIYAPGIDLKLIRVPSNDWEWIYVACEKGHPCPYCGRMDRYSNCIFIAVDGACRGNGTSQAKASIGVFVGPISPYNQSVLLHEPHVTNKIAELKAGILALELATEIQRTNTLGEELIKVVIKSDSEHLVKGMTEWVFKWEINGYKTAKREPVKNAGLFKRLQELVSDLDSVNVEMLFWHVPREMNTDADGLANQAFNS
ncbi:ribonuclease H-like protein [Fusarium austroafricanum]|uniref:ribonuclease H n=1 Tax=Fusarium austroafricanum TaxID=2364996 RepID=A0A8H4NNH9_9HYPO|nr:ribonuclease H-like protein [Fusarium austroafricanum]